MTDDEAFWKLHTGLPRQGPGEAADVAWAARTANVGAHAHICDAGAGSGADLEALRAAAPEGRVTAVEKHAEFVAAAAARALERVEVRQGDIAEIAGPYDFIWAAGSLYFLGVTHGLVRWRPALAPGGAVAFSEPCWLIPNPPEEVRRFWRRYRAMTGLSGLDARVVEAGWRTVGLRILSDAAWEAYYGPLTARLAELRETGSSRVWDEAEEEIALWRRYGHAFGYVLSVVRPA